MSAGYQIRNQNAIHFVTFAVVDWVDVFTRREYGDLVLKSLNHCRIEKGLNVHAWCLMSNHLHLIISAREGFALSDILRDFKKFTSTAITEAIKENTRESRRNWMLWLFESAGDKNSRNKNYQFWRQDNHPVELTDRDMTTQRLDYLHHNPVVAGLVAEPEHYLYSSALDYAGGTGPIPIDFL
jgi:putative transposase